MQIGMVLAGRDYPPDIRVEKEVRALQGNGYPCFVICERTDQNPLREDWEGSFILRIPSPGIFLRKINSLIYRLTFFNIQWFWNLVRIARQEPLDALHVHDLPMAGTALWVGRFLKIPVLLDFHENYPAAVTYYSPAVRTNIQKVLAFFNRSLHWQRYEKRAAKAADRVIVVVDEAKERLSKVGIDHKKITIIENTIDVDHFHELGIDQEIIHKYRDSFLISYIGGYGGKHRGLDTAIDAMPKINQVIPNAKLLLVGKGNIKPVLEDKVQNLGLEDRVIFEDWRPFAEVPSYIEASHVCLIPHQSTPHTEATSPHKLFQYMLMGKPVVVSSCKPLKRVVDETKSGLVFSAGDSDSLAEAILQLQDDQLRSILGQAGKKAVLDRYNWERTAQDLIRLYETI